MTPGPTMAEDLRSDARFDRHAADGGDDENMTAGLPGDWREELVWFNVEKDGTACGFAKALFNEIVDGAGPEAALYG